MKQLAIISVLVILLSSCGSLIELPKLPGEQTKKELREQKRAQRKQIRRMKRANRKLDRLTAKYPELKKDTAVAIPMRIRIPERAGTIIQPLMVPRTLHNEQPTGIITIHQALPDSFIFDNDELLARFSFQDGNAVLDYTIKETHLDTTPDIPCPPIVQSKETIIIETPLTWWQELKLTLGLIFFWILVLCVLGLIVKRVFRF